MIRIETTAEFDAEGRFTVIGRTTEPISPGPHPISIVIGESPAPQSVDQSPESMFVEHGGLLFLNVKPLPGALVDVVKLIEQDRDQRDRQLLGWSE